MNDLGGWKFPYFRFPIRYISQASILPFTDPVENLRMFSPHTIARYRNQKVHVLIQLAGEWVFRVSGVFGFSDSILFLWTTSGSGGEAAGGELWNRCLGCVDIVFLLPLQEDSCHESWWSFCRFETYFSGIFVGKIDDSCSLASTQKFAGPVKVVELDHWNSPKAPPKQAQRSCETKSSDFLPGWFRASAFFSVPRIGYHRAPQKCDSALQLPGCWINNSPHVFFLIN